MSFDEMVEAWSLIPPFVQRRLLMEHHELLTAFDPALGTAIAEEARLRKYSKTRSQETRRQMAWLARCEKAAKKGQQIPRRRRSSKGTPDACVTPVKVNPLPSGVVHHCCFPQPSLVWRMEQAWERLQEATL